MVEVFGNYGCGNLSYLHGYRFAEVWFVINQLLCDVVTTF